jgi:formate hydrogenlyase subunit 3/multisubunit Na+/H+ antiporter MnhD subunit
LRYLLRMPDLEEKLTPADPDDLAASIAFALKFEGASAGMTPMHSWLTLSPSGSFDTSNALAMS